ncbi:hypothetical protein RA27_12800 [Ruegeria sp. ANG-R]|nr:hypothetical protein RA27_12800 [Ruegeria sp. ANG-R]
MVLDECYTRRAPERFSIFARPLPFEPVLTTKIKLPFCAAPEQFLHDADRIGYADLASVGQHPKAERIQTVVFTSDRVSSNNFSVPGKISASAETVHPAGAQTS